MLRMIVACAFGLLVQGCASMQSEREAAAHYCYALSVDPCFNGTLDGQCLRCP